MWWQTYNCSSLLIYRPREDERLSWPGWLTSSGRLTHISGHPSATGRAQDGEKTLARDWRSTAETHSHQAIIWAVYSLPTCPLTDADNVTTASTCSRNVTSPSHPSDVRVISTNPLIGTTLSHHRKAHTSYQCDTIIRNTRFHGSHHAGKTTATQ